MMMRTLTGGVAILLLLVAAHADSADTESWIVASRDTAGQLGGRLAGELASALQSSPVEAIGVCRERAPVIAAELARETGAQVGRTALKLRNPANAPLDWQRSVLESFVTQLAAGASPASLEFTQTVESAGGLERRWMKPIMTAPLCLGCHGRALAPGVAEALAEKYPRDEATGFEAGQLRGAFYVVWREPAGG
jgi:hypothetical protein